MSARRWPLAIGIAGLASLSASVPAKSLSLVWNASPSVPLGLYRIVDATAPRVGDMVVVRPSPPLARFMAERRYVEAGVPLVKPVAAVAGARICRHGRDVTIDGRHAAAALDADRFGRPLPRWAGCIRLDRDELFLIAPVSAASFDSRYFGPVRRSAVVGRAVPLWTWL
jgi:conjugative transfer signal peptidase TraF